MVFQVRDLAKAFYPLTKLPTYSTCAYMKSSSQQQWLPAHLTQTQERLWLLMIKTQLGKEAKMCKTAYNVICKDGIISSCRCRSLTMS